ncbi:MAG: Spy/CpxP family protein refolding chaperone [Campylobacterales bacterium]|nr:Spy/CpxP family protein refolding chaperone [Campylobacterales bacterium]
MRLIFLGLLLAVSLFASDKMRFDFDSLGLSKEQAEDMKQILKAYKHSNKSVNKQIHDIHESKEDLFFSDRFDAAAYAKLEEEEDRLKKNRIKLLESTHKILNEKQRKQFYKMYESNEKSPSW